MDDYGWLFAIAVQLSGLPALPADRLPAVRAVSESEMHAQVCGDDEGCPAPQGWFDPAHNRILLQEYGAQRGAEWESFLLHEYVHALQYALQGPAAFAACTARLQSEQQAYQIQDHYLRRSGVLLRMTGQLREWGCTEDPPTGSVALAAGEH